MELQCKIYSIGKTEKVTDTFSKREFIVKTNEQYEQYLSIQVIKDKCSILDNYSIGQDVKVSLNIKGRLWTNKDGKEVAFNTLECWKIEKLGSETSNSVKEQPKQEPAGIVEVDDNLPF